MCLRLCLLRLQGGVLVCTVHLRVPIVHCGERCRKVRGRGALVVDVHVGRWEGGSWQVGSAFVIRYLALLHEATTGGRKRRPGWPLAPGGPCQSTYASSLKAPSIDLSQSQIHT